MTCIVLDDEPLALRLLKNYIERTDGIQLGGLFLNPAQALARLNEGGVDLLLIDIQMPEISGLDMVGRLQTPPMVVFTTAYPQYAVEGFELNAVDYLLKPIGYDRFLKMLERVKNLKRLTDAASPEVPATITVKSDYHLIPVPVSDIVVVEALDDYIKIDLGSKKIVSRTTMTHMEQLLEPHRFIRVHRSYIVPAERIAWLRNKKIGVGEREIPVGEKYLDAVKKYLG